MSKDAFLTAALSGALVVFLAASFLDGVLILMGILPPPALGFVTVLSGIAVFILFYLVLILDDEYDPYK